MNDGSSFGYAVRKDGGGYRMVNGPDSVEDDPDWIYPNPETENYLALADGPPPAPVPPPKTDAEILADACRIRDELLSVAAIRIAPLQDAVDLDDASDTDMASLKSWKQYRVSVNRISDQPEYPKTIDWPATPT